MIGIHANTEQGLIKQGSSVKPGFLEEVKQGARAFFELVKEEAALEPRAVWVLWLLCFMVILLIIGVMLSPYDTVAVSNEGWVLSS